MARIRSIKPQFFLNEEVSALPYEWRLLFAGLWTQADRDGRLEDRPHRLKAALFPYDDLNIDHGLGSLVNAGLINRYERNGQRLISIPKWSKHQKPHVREPLSEIPPPDDQKQCPAPDEPGGSLILDPDPDQGRSTDALLARFEAFWAVYPRHVAKDAARKVWVKLAPDAALAEVIVARVQEHAASPQWRKDGGQFVPHARTWLNQRRWEDEMRQSPRLAGSQRPDWNGHMPPCDTQQECTRRALEEMRGKPA